MNNFEKARFCIDAATGGIFEGYTGGDYWNGFECPYFEQRIALDVLKSSVRNGYVWFYDEERDIYTVKNSNDPPEYEPEVFEGQIITIAGKNIKVYPIGAYSWVWSKYDD